MFNHSDIKVPLGVSKIYIRETDGKHVIMCWISDNLWVSRIIIIGYRCLWNYDIFFECLYDEIRKNDSEKRDDDERNDSACKCSVSLLFFVPLKWFVCKDVTLKDELFNRFHYTILILINNNSLILI